MRTAASIGAQEPPAAMTDVRSGAIRSVLVVIPARNEDERIDRCLRSVLLAAMEARRRCAVDTWVVVAADSCTDDTVHIASGLLADSGEVIVGEWGEVGSARRAGVAAGLARRACERTWIANTDADCEVPERWLTDQLAHAARGADAVLGIVSVDNFDDHPPHVAEQFAHRYALRSDGSHDHVHGANFGVRADRYLSVGGWPRVGVSEDHGLAGELASDGAVIVRTIDVAVATSGRRAGRARGGFADLLVQLGETA
jgi:glycosyltransferase involved in cell wall biosynthesis